MDGRVVLISAWNVSISTQVLVNETDMNSHLFCKYCKHKSCTVTKRVP